MVLYAPHRRNGLQTVLCSPEAAARGVHPGMPLAEARALLEAPGALKEQAAGLPADNIGGDAACLLEPDDPAADRRGLRRLAVGCGGFSPRVGIEESDRPEALLLDVTGCGHLFGGEERLAGLVLAVFDRWGFHVRAAMADTPGAAWAVSHFAGATRGPRAKRSAASGGALSRAVLVPPAGQARLLPSLPVEALRLSTPTVQALHELGIRQIGRLLALPRSSLPSRFGPEVLKRLDAALGGLPEPIVPERPPEPVEAALSFEIPTDERTILEEALRRLIGRVLDQLAPRQEGLLQLDCRLERPQQPPLGFQVDLVRPSADPDHLWQLARLSLERAASQSLSGKGDRHPSSCGPAKPGTQQAEASPFFRTDSQAPDDSAPVSGVSLRAARTAPLTRRQRDLFGHVEASGTAPDLTLLLERLSGRLGNGAVLRPCLVPEAQPELACRYVPWTGDNPRSAADAAGIGRSAGRPLKKRLGCSEKPTCPSGVGRQAGSLPCIGPVRHRPLRLLSRPVPVQVVSPGTDGPPVRLRWQGRELAVVCAWGPERIETGWWRRRAIRRDYYRIETAEGRRLWLFRRLNDGDWFLHGAFE